MVLSVSVDVVYPFTSSAAGGRAQKSAKADMEVHQQRQMLQRIVQVRMYFVMKNWLKLKR